MAPAAPISTGTGTIRLIKLEPDDDDTLLVTCPALPEVATFGEDEADAVRRARDAIEEALAARIGDGMDIPRAGIGPIGGTTGRRRYHEENR